MLCAFADVWRGVLCHGAGLRGEDHLLPVWPGVWQYLLVSVIQFRLLLVVESYDSGFSSNVYQHQPYMRAAEA